MSRFLTSVDANNLKIDLSNITVNGISVLQSVTVDELLDDNGKLKTDVLPPISLSSITVVADIPARDALLGSIESGDSVKVTSTNQYFVFDGVSFIQVNTENINSLNDVTVSGSQTNSHILKWENTEWKDKLLLINDISEVSITNPLLDNSVLIYKTGSNKYENEKLCISCLSNVNIVSPLATNYLKWNGVDNWVNSNINLEDIFNVDIDTVQANQYLGWNGVDKWINLVPYTSPLTIKGDLLVRGMGLHSRLPIGNLNDILTVTGVDTVAWAPPVRNIQFFTTADETTRDLLVLIAGDTVLQLTPKKVYIWTGIEFIQIDGGGGPVNTPPTIVAIDNINVFENTSHLFNSDQIVVGDIDGDDLTVNITMLTNPTGVFTFNSAGLTSSSGNSSQVVQMVGTISAVNTALNTFSFDAGLTAGITNIKVEVNDGVNMVSDTILATVDVPPPEVPIDVYFDGKNITDNVGVYDFWDSYTDTAQPILSLTNSGGTLGLRTNGGVDTPSNCKIQCRLKSNAAIDSFFKGGTGTKTIILLYQYSSSNAGNNVIWAEDLGPNESRIQVDAPTGNINVQIASNPVETQVFNNVSKNINVAFVGKLNYNGTDEIAHLRYEGAVVNTYNFTSAVFSTDPNATSIDSRIGLGGALGYIGMFYGVEVYERELTDNQITDHIDDLFVYYSSGAVTYPKIIE